MSEEAILNTDVERSGKSFDTPILVGALVVIAAMLAWFFLGSDKKLVESAPALDAETTIEAEQIQAVVAAETPNSELLSRARLAADAGMLVEPAGSNALYYYGLFLEQEPDSEEIQAELSQLLDRIGGTIEAASADGQWGRASYLVEQLSNAGFDHAAVTRFFDDLQVYRAAQRDAALAAAASGDETRANSILESLAQLPRSQPGELLELRSEVRDALVAQRLAAQAEAERAAASARAEANRRAAAQTPSSSAADRQAPRTASVQAPAAAPARPQFDAVRAALAAGQLTGQGGALTLVQALPAGSEGLAELKGDVAGALERLIRDEAAAGRPLQAEQLLAGWQNIANNDALASDLQGAVDRAFIEQAVAETVSAATLRRTAAVAPIYPRSAIRRNLSGRVKVEFTVDVDGSTREIEVVESIYGGIFDRSASRAISEWRYEPRVVRGQRVAQRVYAYLDYNLE